jgi:glycosyltransferase involved in cell wall biosynthesis
VKCDLNSVFRQKERILMVPVCMFEREGGMAEYFRTWIAEHGRCLRSVQALDCADPLIAWANRKRNYRLITLLAQMFGFRAVSLLVNSRIRRLLNSFPNIDVVQMTVLVPWSDVLAQSFVQCSTQVRVLATLHDPVMHSERGRLKRALFQNRALRNCLQLAAEHPRYFIHVHNAELLRGVPNSDRARIVCYEHPLPERRAVRKRANGSVWVGLLGRIEKYKGLDVFLDALKLVEDLRPDLVSMTRAIIAGQGKFNKSGFGGLAINVTFKNRFLSDVEFHQLMADLDVLVLPYVEATQSGVAAMALTYGTRIVASDVGGIRCLLEAHHAGTGVLIPPRDPKALAAAIIVQVDSALRRPDSGRLSGQNGAV